MSKLSMDAFDRIFRRRDDLGVDRIVRAIHLAPDDMVTNHQTLLSSMVDEKDEDKIRDAILTKNNLHQHSLGFIYHNGNDTHRAKIKEKFPHYDHGGYDQHLPWYRQLEDIARDDWSKKRNE